VEPQITWVSRSPVTSVLLICGSLQKVSSNRALLDVVRARFAELGIETTESVDVGSVPPCSVDRAEAPGSVVVDFRAQLDHSDAVVLSSPEYAAGIPGALKNALDWIVGSAELYAKPVAVLSAGTTGGEYARRQLIRSLTWQGAHVVAHLGVAAPRTKSDEAGNIVDQGTLDELAAVAHQVGEVLSGSPVLLRRFVDETLAWAGVGSEHVAPIEN